MGPLLARRAARTRKRLPCGARPGGQSTITASDDGWPVLTSLVHVPAPPNPPLLIRLGSMTRKLLVVLVVMLVLLVAIPLGVGAAMGMCPNLHSSICPSAVGSCAAIMGLMVLVLIAVLGTVGTRTS